MDQRTRDMRAVHLLRVHIKALAAEWEISEREERQAAAEYKPWLHSQRMWRIKKEARLAHLALAFVEGKRYRDVEQNAATPVDAGKLTCKLQKFLVNVKKAEVEAWLE